MNLFTDFEARIKTALEQIDLVREKRSELDFGRRFIATRNARAVKSSPDFIRIREEVLAVILHREPGVDVATPAE